MRSLLTLGLLLAVATWATAQTLQPEIGESQPNLKVYRLSGVEYSAQPQAINTPQSFTAIAFEIPEDQSYGKASVWVNGQELPLHADPHRLPGEGNLSTLMSVEGPLTRFSISAPGWSQDLPVKVFLIHSGEAKVQQPRKAENAAACDFPPAIPQSEWRAGLTPPDPGRSFSDVNNLIVHHSAGSNTATNYTQVVRDIYVFHTQGRGWSDIGYNYVIAQNGDLYLARDPEGGDQDRVIGAHFCGANTGTMGVCLLGDYTNVVPPDTMLGTLELVLAWKAYKDEMDPLATASHRLNANLGVIAGHRDGCATECPGGQTYARLDEMRQRVADRMAVCDGPEPEPVDSVAIYRITSTTRNIRIFTNLPYRFSITETRLIDMQGRVHVVPWQPHPLATWELELGQFHPGVYVLHYVVAGEVRRQRIRVL